MTFDDDSLMQRIASGDEEAFRLLVARWEQPVFAFLVHMLGSRDDAQDLAQDTFLKVYDQARRYRPDGRFRSWLLRIAGNKARSALRRRKVLRWVDFDPASHDQASPQDDPARRLERDETAARVRAAVGNLPERQRQAVVLRRFQGCSYQEIAEILDTTVPAVESLLQRAAAALRLTLAPDLDPARREVGT
ncbi:MAG: RNA polymerase sigma factor [Candidatus Krumholzibacteriia bacterium]